MTLSQKTSNLYFVLFVAFLFFNYRVKAKKEKKKNKI